MEHKKLDDLMTYLRSLGNVAIGFSGGVDSTFLLSMAHQVLGDKAVAITAVSSVFPDRELKESQDFCKERNIRQIICQINNFNIPGFAENPTNRCYICKKGIFSKFIQIAQENNIAAVCEGSNMDDLGDYRPGLIAVSELGIKSPLRQAKLYKQEIRELSKEMGLPTWEKPSYACLATRFPYGQKITAEKLIMIDKAEQLLLDLGFSQMRVRIHDLDARIEVMPKEFSKVLENADLITGKFKEFGFNFVSMDLQGYRTGSLNIGIEKK